MSKRKVIQDCDITFGVQGCDVDDGMAMMLLLGSPDVELIGVTTSYGNNEQDVVWEAAQKFMTNLDRTDIPLHRGSSIPGQIESDAATFLAETVSAHKGEIELLVTGTTTNLLGAWTKDPEFFANLKSLTFMGGITEALVFAKGIMDEMNLSRDAHATVTALREYYKAHCHDEDPMTRTAALLTGNNCLRALFTREEYREKLGGDTPAEKFIRERTDYWFDDNDDDWGIQGFYNWDVTAAAYMLWPELFRKCPSGIWLSEEDMQGGYLRREITENTDVEGIILYLPEIDNEKAFRERLYETWKNVPIA